MSDFRIRFLFCLALIILLGGCKPDGFDDNPSVEAPATDVVQPGVISAIDSS